MLAVLALATFTEVVQLVVPSRSFNVLDWLANVVGIILGLAGMGLVRGKLRVRSEQVVVNSKN